MLKSLESHNFWVLPAIAVLQTVYADLRLDAVLGGRRGAAGEGSPQLLCNLMTTLCVGFEFIGLKVIGFRAAHASCTT